MPSQSLDCKDDVARGEERPRILFINRSYWPDTEATGQLLTQLCSGLVGEFEVEVMAGRPNYVDAGGAAKEHAGVVIRRIRHSRFPKFSGIGKTINLTTFAAAAFLETLRLRPGPDLVVTETDPFLLPLLGRWLKWRYGCKFVAYLQDIYPDVAVAVGAVREGFVSRTLRTLLTGAYRQADRIVVLSDDMRQRCLRNGVPDDRIEVIHNWADCDRIRPVARDNEFSRRHGLQDKFVVMYSGNLGRVHLLEPILEACRQLRERDIQFVFIGEGAQKARLQRVAEEEELRNVLFLPYQPREHLSQSLGAADVHMVTMLPAAHGCVMPSKLYGILASGRAVLSVCPLRTDVSRIVTDHDVGLVCDPESPVLNEQLVAAIRSMYDDRSRTAAQGERARTLCLEQFNGLDQIRKFRDLLHAALTPQERSVVDILRDDTISV